MSEYIHDGNVTKDGAVPVRYITVNQVVAWNLAWYRKQVGLTQAELGERIGWTNTAVSEAERSWDGRRTREFDAQTMAAIAAALGVPLMALLLPPEDDGVTARYTITLDDGTPQGMAGLMAVIMPDLDAETAVLEAYRARVRRAAEAYLAPDLATDIARLLGVLDDKEFAAVTAARLRAALAAAGGALEALRWLGRLADRIEEESR